MLMFYVHFRRKQVNESDKYLHVSGLNSLNYTIKEFTIKPTHIYILLDTVEKEVKGHRQIQRLFGAFRDLVP